MLLGNGLLPMFAVAGGAIWNGATWALDGSGRAYNVPTLGSELLTDGGFENWSSATDLTSWDEVLQGATTVNRESSIVHGGTYAARIDTDASNSGAGPMQTVALSAGQWTFVEYWARTSASGKTIRLATNGAYVGLVRDPGASWTKYSEIFRRTNETGLYFGRRVAASSSSIYVDDASVKVILFAATLATIAGTSATQTAAAKIHTLTTGAQAGVVSLLDSASNPRNGLFAYHDGTGVTLDKMVNGTWTNLVPRVTVAFSSLAQTEVRPLGSNQFDLYYGGTKRGSTVTVSDASIISNTIYGVFSTYSGNLFSEFTLDGSVIPFGF